MKSAGIVLLCLFQFVNLSAQPSNEAIVRMKIDQLIDSLGTIQRVEAFFPMPSPDPARIDSSTQLILSFSPPTIRYEKYGKDSVQRSMILPALLQQDTTASRLILRYEDQLDYRQFRRISKESPEYLKGEDPTFRGKWLRPLLAITIGTGINIGLFYLRSR